MRRVAARAGAPAASDHYYRVLQATFSRGANLPAFSRQSFRLCALLTRGLDVKIATPNMNSKGVTWRL
jgi:hypothetical protein